MDLNVLIFGSGYNYSGNSKETSEAKEIRASKTKKTFLVPHTKTFKALADNLTSKGYQSIGVSSLEVFVSSLEKILAQPETRIKNLGILGHGNGGLDAKITIYTSHSGDNYSLKSTKGSKPLIQLIEDNI